MRKGKRNDELVYFCSGIPVTRARAQELRSSPSREDPMLLQMPSSPVILRSGRVLRSPNTSKVNPQQDPVCQLLNQILNKHRKTPPQEDPLSLQLQQILKPLSARSSTITDVNSPSPLSALLGSSMNADAQPIRLPPTKTESSKFQILGPPSEMPRFSILEVAKPPRAVCSPVAKPRGPSPPRAKLPVPSDVQQITRSARIIQACSLLLSDVLGRVESVMGLWPKPILVNDLPKTPTRPDRMLKENKQTKPVTGVSKPVKYIDRGTSTVELIDLTPQGIPDEPIGDPGFCFNSVGSKSIHSTTCTVDPQPRPIKTEPFAGWEHHPSHLRVPVRTRSFRTQVPSPTRGGTPRGRAISVPCSIL